MYVYLRDGATCNEYYMTNDYIDQCTCVDLYLRFTFTTLSATIFVLKILNAQLEVHSN